MELHNIQAEQSVLGCIILDYKNTLYKVNDILTADDFYELKHQLIYKAILKLEKEKKGIDAIIIGDCLAGELDGCGGLSYISSLPDYIINVRNVQEYAEIVKDLSEKRYIMAGVDELRYNVIDGDCKEHIDLFLKKVSDLKKREIKGISTAADLIGTAFDEIQEGNHRGLLTGFDTIDEKTKGLQPGWLVVIGADSGEGKTTLALNFMLNMARNKKACLFMSCEMSNIELLKRIISADSEVENFLTKNDIKNSPFLQEAKKDEMLKARMQTAGDLSELPMFFEDKSQSIDEICNTAKVLQSELFNKGEKIDCIFIDYIQLIKVTGKHGNRENEVGSISTGLKLLAKELHTPVVTMSQVNRERFKDDKTRLKRLSDLRESQRIGHDADMVLFINQDKEDMSKAIINCDKYRHGERGWFFSVDCLNKYSKFKEV